MKQYITTINSIRTQMNKAGSNRQPFLFGINFDMTEGFFIEDPMCQKDVLFAVKSVTNKCSQKQAKEQYPIQFEKKPISYADYQEKFDIIHKGLLRGDSFLSNLTIKTPIETNLTIEEIANLSDAPYLLYIPDKLVCFSPERFIKIANGVISSNPMKGTIEASVPNAEQVILNDFKETAEHNTIVDLIRNDLSMIANKVHVKRYRYIDRIKTRDNEILQVSSEIEGQLDSDYHSRLGDILFTLLPAGSICGAPKEATVQLIQAAEKESRGFYTGVFGYYDGKDFDSAVLIRFIEKEGDQLFFRSGGGITAYSKCQDEYKEVLDKIYLPFV